jgi:hypothetical protein
MTDLGGGSFEVTIADSGPVANATIDSNEGGQYIAEVQDVPADLAPTCFGCHSSFDPASTDRLSLHSSAIACDSNQWLNHAGNRVTQTESDRAEIYYLGSTCVSDTVTVTYARWDHETNQAYITATTDSGTASLTATYKSTPYAMTDLGGGSFEVTISDSGPWANVTVDSNHGGQYIGEVQDIPADVAPTCFGCHSSFVPLNKDTVNDHTPFVSCSNQKWTGHAGPKATTAEVVRVEEYFIGAACP